MANNRDTKTEQVTFRLTAGLIERLDSLASKLSKEGMAVTRTDAVRIVLHRGLSEIEKGKKK